MKTTTVALLISTTVFLGYTKNLVGAAIDATVASDVNSHRRLQCYFATSDAAILGTANPAAAMGNPMRGLYTSPRWTGEKTPDTVPDSIEMFFIGFDEVMLGYNSYNWTVLDNTLTRASSRSKHVIWRVFCHYPGQPLRVPKFLIDLGIPLIPTAADGVSPQYDDARLKEAFRQFIAALGARYDGNRAIACIQLGLLGKWGEWHTAPEYNLISNTTRNEVAGWYASAFKTTQLQARGPISSVFAPEIGLHDDSFAYSTLGTITWFFWPVVVRATQTDFWKKGIMGGETRPELQGSIFEPTYRANSDQYKQDFMECVRVTRASLMFHHHAFEGQMSGPELANARNAHVQLGYNFQVTRISLTKTSNTLIALEVSVAQTGVAPFYYPLNLVLSCPGTTKALSGVQNLVETGSSLVFPFADIPGTSACLGALSISLQSNYTFSGRPIKFAQGASGKISLSLPLPPTAPTAPVMPPPIAPDVTPAQAPPTGTGFNPSQAPVSSFVNPLLRRK